MKTAELSDKQLKMQELCKVLSNLQNQRDNARISRINTDIAYTNLQSLILATIDDIARLEANGIKRPTNEEIQEAISKTQAKQISQPRQ